MTRKPRIKIRMKILVSLLLLVTVVVSVITFTMANMFHDDKQTYLHDLSAIMALSTAEECRAVLRSYGERLQVYGRIMTAREVERRERRALLEGFFDDLPELVMVVLYENGRELAAATHTEALVGAGVDPALARERMDALLPSFGGLAPEDLWVRNTSLSRELPSLTLAVPVDAVGERAITAAALIRLDGLLRLAARPSPFEISLVDPGGTLLAHRDPRRVAGREPIALDERVRDIHGKVSRGMTLEYSEAGTDWIAGFAAVDLGNVTAVARTPRSVAYLAARQLLDALLIVGLGLLLLATLAGMFWSRRITGPIERLAGAAKEIGKGKFDVAVRVDSGDEIGALSASFNQMASELHERDAALAAAQAQLIQSEKLAAFGQLGAGIAHEVKNPLAGILGCAQLSMRKVEPDTPVHKNLVLIEKETRRCKEIIESLLKFARQEKAVFDNVAINSVAEDAIAIVDHQLSMNKVQVESDLAPDLPRILGNANQLQQVLINLMINAQQAMEGNPGNIKVSTHAAAPERIEVRVSDTGPGMTAKVKAKLFEPFFTTKPGGKGTGLGLSVSYGIVKDHGGEIVVESELGQGATFVITLPVVREAPVAAPVEAPVEPVTV